MPDLITLGETMVLFYPLTGGTLRHAPLFAKTAAGAESNVAIAFTRLGGSAGWISRVGDDEFGRFVVAFVRGEGVDTRGVRVDPERQTGCFFKYRRPDGRVEVEYYRRDSAASRLEPADVEEACFEGARLLHLTGITPALGPGCRAALERAMDIAAARGMEICFDPNLRRKLWDLEEARQVIRPLAARAHVVVATREECRLLWGARDTRDAARRLLDAGARVALIKLGAEGAYFEDRDGRSFHTPALEMRHVQDPVGAGDGFAAGFLYGRLAGWRAPETVRLAVTVGALAVGADGDTEGYPDLETVQALWRGRSDVSR